MADLHVVGAVQLPVTATKYIMFKPPSSNQITQGMQGHYSWLPMLYPYLEQWKTQSYCFSFHRLTLDTINNENHAFTSCWLHDYD